MSSSFRCTPVFKSNRNLFCNVKWWYLFSMYRFGIFLVAWWGLLNLLWKISWVYDIAARFCYYSNKMRFEKRAAKRLQHGHTYGDILMLYDIITTYGWFFCYNWHELCCYWNISRVNYSRNNNKKFYFSSIYYCLVRYAIQISNMGELLPIPFYAIMQRVVPADSGAGTSSYWVMLAIQQSEISQYFKIGPRQNWFISQFLRWCST